METAPLVNNASHSSYGARDRRREHGFVVAGDSEVDRLVPGLFEHGKEHRAVRVADHARPERAALHQLVAGRAHADPRARETQDLGDVEAGEHPEVRRREQGARVEHALPGFEIAAGRAHVIAVRRGREDRDRTSPSARVQLDHHDGVGTRGHRRAGHDPDRLAGSDSERSAPRPPASSPTTRNVTGDCSDAAAVSDARTA